MSTTREVFVKAAVPEVADAFATTCGGRVVPDVLNTSNDPGDAAVVLYRKIGSPWTVFSPYNVVGRELAAKLGRALQTDVLSYESESVSAWQEAVLVRDGEEVEELLWGPSYDEELEELAEELGETVPSVDQRYAKWHARADVRDGHGTDQYLFRSTLREVDARQLQGGEAFVDDFFRHHLAWRPSLNVGVWFDERRGKVVANGMKQALIERADAVIVP